MLMERALMNSRPGVAAAYLTKNGDSVAAAPIRARVRLCCSVLAEHRSLRHQSVADMCSADGDAIRGDDMMQVRRAGGGATGHDDRCRACWRATETVEHVFLHCEEFTAARTAAAAELRAAGMRLDIAAVGGVAPAGSSKEMHVALLRGTAGLLLAVRARMRV
jgi:hypothetical protein